ncbi:hypothetical protein KP509_39G024400 [Ceratopteris richardii]|uniref:1-phosphatidylinositol 4-kinase n=1 Tax=Ceratopteris richardii TaxID=49495 RepID=A0A8T2PZB1_CERRI|nr:hypothetical protein KP509_39G024400 [Ceratopteris richardii]KAH7276845.1 hypothetical protein KP509_39G024400 [Ceratopteris richardii]
MPPSVDTPVKTRFPVPFGDGLLGVGRTSSENIHTRPPVSRRIFVQTETGSVLGLELDQTDNAQTVKKKMQTILNVPTEQTNLVFGSTILKSDLSELRNDSPLLLTRELQRSLSTPCFFHPSDAQVKMDTGQPFEVVGGVGCCLQMKQIIEDVVKALNCGVEPLAASGGLGGAYYFRNCKGESVAVVKPTDEEPFAPNNPKGFVGKALGQPGLKRAVRVGETGVREVAAYLLDHGNFARVPPTVLVKVSHRIFHINSSASVHKEPDRTYPVSKLASCQQFVPHDHDASDHGTSRFSVSSVHRIGILDVRIFNTDRHAGNILIRYSNAKDSQGDRSNIYVNETLELIPIDHGLCLPEELEDTYFEWLHWPQASVPFTEEELEYINKLDAGKDSDMLRTTLPMLREACHRMLVLSTTLLKKAAAAGLCLAEIGEMMTRDQIEERSELEMLCFQAKDELSGADIDDGFSDFSLTEANEEQFDFELDENDEDESASELEESFSAVPILRLPDNRHWAFASSRPFNEQDMLLEASLKTLELHGSKAVPPMPISDSTHGKLGILKKVRESPKITSPRFMSYFHKLSSPRAKTNQFSPEKEHSKSILRTNVNGSNSSGDMLTGFPKVMLLRSVSCNHNKQQYVNRHHNYDHTEIQDALKGVPLTPAPKLRCNTYTYSSPNQLSLGEMNKDEWMSFLSIFNELLEQALTIKCTQKASSRQRLGTSCQF